MDSRAESPLRHHPRGWLIPGAGALGAAVLAGASFAPLLRESVVIGLVNIMVAITFTATGLLLFGERGQRGTGVALVGAAGFYVVSYWWSWPAHWQVGPVALLSYVGGYLWFVLGIYALLRYPGPRLARWWDRTYVALLAGWVVLPKLLLATVSSPAWIGDGFGPAAWWPALAPDADLFRSGAQVADVGLVVVAVLVLVPLTLKVQRSHSVDRIDAVPGMVAAATVMLSGSAYLLARFGPVSAETVDVLRAVIGIAALFTPIAFLTSAMQRRLARAALADLVVQLVDSPEPRAVQDELRRSLPDPTLTVWFWLPERAVFVDVDAHPAEVPPTEGRFPVEVRTGDDAPLAVIVCDPSLRRHPGLVAPAVAACRFALENTRLQADLREQLRELQAAAIRLTHAESTGRRKIERDLHDGAQQTLWAARMSLGEARRQVEAGSVAHAAIRKAQHDLTAATDELRRLAGGISPPILTQSGLRPALEGVIERLDMRIVSSIPDRRFDAAVESTAYFVACEALTNAMKYSAATVVRVDIEVEPDTLAIRVVDDGTGGACPSDGTGLAGIRDRARAIGGSMTVCSPVGGGTRVEVSLPCA
ncbi:histidine kinase [Pseudonocardia nematodicida]|uniref:histidine kinase n=1 Tax=Pseudonocardia nematodicida TaxID=1206997 RepID=A0ABV1KCZ7_9PSEU